MDFRKGLVFLSLGLWSGLGADASSSARAGDSISFTRSGSDQLSTASLAAGSALSFTYEPSYGQMIAIAEAGGFSLSFTSDALLHLSVSQAVTENGKTLLSAAITYDADGLRASRTVSAGSEGEGSSTTLYWHGGGLHPLVVTRDGVNYRLIGKGVVERMTDQPSRSYLHGDHLGSVRMVTDDQGAVTQSLGYDGDYGLTRIEGESTAADADSMASFYRFQGQEQEIFPLAKLGISDSALGQWLDSLQLYHFPWRDYGAGLASFTQTDPIPRDDSLYAALGANPVNYTDETGGMFQPPTSILQNIDPERERLLNLVVSDQSATINPAESKMLYDLFTRVQDEIGVFRDQIRDTRGVLTEKISVTARRVLLDAGDERMYPDHAAQLRAYWHPDTRDAQRKRDLFASESQNWLESYEIRRENWLARYDKPIMNSVLMNLQEDEDVTNDQKGDEKAANDDELSPLVPSTGPQGHIAGDPDSDDDVTVGFPTQGGLLDSDQDRAPAHVDPNNAPQDNGRTIAPLGPRQEDNDRIRPCCNIL